MFLVFLPKEIKIDMPLRKSLNYKYLFCLIILIMKKLIILLFSFLILIVVTIFIIQFLEKTIPQKISERHQLIEIFLANNNLDNIKKLLVDLQETESFLIEKKPRGMRPIESFFTEYSPTSKEEIRATLHKKDLIQKIKNSLATIDLKIAKDHTQNNVNLSASEKFQNIVDGDYGWGIASYQDFIDVIMETYHEFLYPDKKTEIEKLYKIQDILIYYVLISLIVIFCINIFVLIVYFIILKTKFKVSDFDFKNYKNQIIQTAISIILLLYIALDPAMHLNNDGLVTLSKIVISTISFYFVWLMKDKKSFFFLLFILLGILFNPLIQFEDVFEETLWQVIIFTAMIIFFIYANLNFKKQKKD